MHKFALGVVAAILTALPATAADDPVRAAVNRLLPERSDVEISDSPLAGIREVAVGTQVFYVSADGAYVLGGPLIATMSGRNVTEDRVAVSRQRILDGATELPTFRYPAQPAKHRVTVVTDIDCPYCRRLHKDLPDYAAAGIDVTYLMLPRAGKGSSSYVKTVNAACADAPEAAITAAMNGATPAPAECDHPIDNHMALARELGVTSTPTIVLEDGRVVLGQKKPADLLEAIGN